MTTTTYPDVFTKNDYKAEDEAVTRQKIDALVRAMTFEEKCSLLGGNQEPADHDPDRRAVPVLLESGPAADRPSGRDER